MWTRKKYVYTVFWNEKQKVIRKTFTPRQKWILLHAQKLIQSNLCNEFRGTCAIYHFVQTHAFQNFDIFCALHQIKLNWCKIRANKKWKPLFQLSLCKQTISWVLWRNIHIYFPEGVFAVFLRGEGWNGKANDSLYVRNLPLFIWGKTM